MSQKNISTLLFFLFLSITITLYAQDNTQMGLPEGAIARLGKGGINVMQFSPDGKHLVVGTDVGVWVYDTGTGDEKGLFADNPGQINVLAFSPDGKTIASGGFANKIIQLWDLATGKKIRNFLLSRESDSTHGLAFSEDGGILIIIQESGVMKHWDINTNEIKFNANMGKRYEAITYSKQLKMFATGLENGRIHFYDASTGKSKGIVIGHSSLFNKDDKDIWSLGFSKDGTLLASGSMDKTVRLWDTVKRKSLGKFTGHETLITAVALSYNGNILASGDDVKKIILWDTRTKQKLGELVGHTNGICAFAFSPDGTILASGSNDGTIRFWNPKTVEEISIFTSGHSKWIQTLAFTKNDTSLASTDFNGTVVLWNMKTKQGLSYLNIGQGKSVVAATISQDAVLFSSNNITFTTAFHPLNISSMGGGSIRSEGLHVWNISTGEEIHGPWENQNVDINAMTFSPDRKILVVNDTDKGVYSWNIDTGEKITIFNNQSRWENELTFSPNGKFLAFTGRNSSTHICESITYEEITPEDMGEYSAIAFSPDNTLLAVRQGDGGVLWDIKGTEFTKRGSMKVGNSWGLLFSHDGKAILSTVMRGLKFNLGIYDIATGNYLYLPGHTEDITAMRFSHNGQILATGSKDGTILLWDWEKINKKISTGD
ncbi:WD40 repeat domain-containing protein [Candidatus Poribacteria bacterium]|nr:WD40 repeat domain-containing protein [Candidatus Poribacteria bacterium]